MSTFHFELTLTRPMLGTNSAMPDIHQDHVINKQRDIIMEKSKTNKTVDKYLDALQITPERGAAEVTKLYEKLVGRNATPEEFALIEKGEVAALVDSLRETVGEFEERGVTVFFRDSKGMPCIGDHMIYGFMKAASDAICKTAAKAKGTVLQSNAYTASIINQHVRAETPFISFDQDISRNADKSPNYLVRSIRVVTAQGPRVSIVKSEQMPAGTKLVFDLNVFPNSPLTEDHLKQIFDYGQWSGLGQWRNAGYGMFTYTMAKVK